MQVVVCERVLALPAGAQLQRQHRHLRLEGSQVQDREQTNTVWVLNIIEQPNTLAEFTILFLSSSGKSTVLAMVNLETNWAKIREKWKKQTQKH